MLQARDVNNENIIHFIRFPVQFLNPTAPPEIIIHLWNNKGGVCEKPASNIKISVLTADKETSGGSDYTGQEIIDDNLVQAKSNGIEGTGIIDDAQSSWTPIGKINYLSIGDIPTNTARKIHFRLKSTLLTSSTRSLFFLKISYNYGRTQTYTYTIAINNHMFYGEKFYGGWFY